MIVKSLATLLTWRFQWEGAISCHEAFWEATWAPLGAKNGPPRLGSLPDWTRGVELDGPGPCFDPGDARSGTARSIAVSTADAAR